MGGGKWIILKLEGENREYRKLQGQNDNFPKNNCFGLSMEEYNLIMCGGRKKTVVVKNTNSFANRLKMFEPK